MLHIAHRVNSAAELAKVPESFGVEVDLRDDGEALVLRHDPFGGGESFDDYLKLYNHRLLILNVKSERIEHRVLEAIREHGVQDYFFLDCSFPMMRTLIELGERRIAVRFSEFEPVESALSLAGQVDWVWVDCFTRLPFDGASYGKLREHFQLCVVSPELQGRPVDAIDDYARELEPYPVDAVCTKRPDLWERAIRRSVLDARTGEAEGNDRAA